MANISQEEMDKKIDSLPQEVQDLLYSPEMYTAIKQISSKHQLHIDQMDLLETETSQLLLGLTETSQFPQTIAQSLKVDNVQASSIAKDIDEVLLSKIRTAMKQAYTQATTTPTVPASQPAAVTMQPTMPEKSVIMPSSVAKTPTAPAVTPAPLASTDMQINAPKTQDALAAPMHEAEIMFNEATVSIPPKVVTPVAPAPTPEQQPRRPEIGAPTQASGKIEPPKPAPIYKADPYREPIE